MRMRRCGGLLSARPFLKFSFLVRRQSSHAPYSLQSLPFDSTTAPPHPKTQRTEFASETSSGSRVDPYKLIASDLSRLRSTLLHLLGSSHPQLSQIAQYYFLGPSKQLRPLIVLLFARAVNGLGSAWQLKEWEAASAHGRAEELDHPLSRPDVLNDWNPNMPDHTASFSTAFDLRSSSTLPLSSEPPSFPLQRHPSLVDAVLPTQYRLAQIAEMIHVASLLHDDVLDVSPLRRGSPSAPAQFGNKLSILAGDFMLGRASAALSRLGESEVVELISGVIANLVEGELLQLRETHAPSTMGDMTPSTSSTEGRPNQNRWNIYLKKTYLKTASLMAKSARASVILGGVRENELWKEVAYAYGRNLGIAFQLTDDILDYEAGETVLGKPGGADLRLGLTTGPALYAWEEHEEMGPLIARKFEREGDVELARDLVRRSSGVERTRLLAREHAEKAAECLSFLPDSQAKKALQNLCEIVVSRKW